MGTTVYTSDRNLKADFKPVNAADILQRVSALPVTSWDFKSDPSKRHVGPMAQDFHEAFGLNGDDETHINAVDLAGVSLAAIQELDRQGRQKSAEIADLRAQLARQSAQLAAQSEAIAGMTAAIETVTARLASLGGRGPTVARAVALAPHQD